MTDDDVWEAHAGWWRREFTQGADPEYEEQILPLVERWTAGATRVLDVGAGEGQVGRAAGGAGALVCGLERSWSQVAEAARRGPGHHYVQGEAARLPWRDESFDAAVACLVFEHIDDLDLAVAEVARVLEPDGRFLLILNHPLLNAPNSGWIDDQVLDPPEQYWRVGAYLPEHKMLERFDDGILIPFIHRPLGRYLNALIRCGLLLEYVEEPVPPPGYLAEAGPYQGLETIPRLLLLVTSRAGTVDRS
jgi:SAM-dependent methyltransferase